MATHFAENRSDDKYNPSFLEKKIVSENEDLKIDDYFQAEYNEPFCENEILEALERCSGSSPGPDDVEYELIKNLTTQKKQAILNAFNQIGVSGIFPDEWRTATGNSGGQTW
jgi:hypothetical protein